ncbi:MAG: metal-dependent hydrolase, partial [Acidobacteriota bacterium]
MSSPVGHSLMGMILYLSYNTWGSLWSNRNEVLLYIFFTVAPDLDLIPGLLGGDIYRYHHGPPHSIFFALLFTLPFSLPRLKRGIKRFLSSWGIFFSL